MPLLASRAPRPALSEHPGFALMLTVALERFHCTLAEIREDYWLGRIWRALAGDPVLAGRVARRGVTTVLLTGPECGPPPRQARERERWERHVAARIAADTGRPLEAWELLVRWSQAPIEVQPASVRSLLAQALEGDQRWGDLARYAADLAPVTFPVAVTADAAVSGRRTGAH